MAFVDLFVLLFQWIIAFNLNAFIIKLDDYLLRL